MFNIVAGFAPPPSRRSPLLLPYGKRKLDNGGRRALAIADNAANIAKYTGVLFIVCNKQERFHS